MLHDAMGIFGTPVLLPTLSLGANAFIRRRDPRANHMDSSPTDAHKFHSFLYVYAPVFLESHNTRGTGTLQLPSLHIHSYGRRRYANDIPEA